MATKDTRFAIGQTVRSTVTAQGLHEGRYYTVTDVNATSLAFGSFVTYDLWNPEELTGVFGVVNGHLILTEGDDADDRTTLVFSFSDIGRKGAFGFWEETSQCAQNFDQGELAVDHVGGSHRVVVVCTRRIAHHAVRNARDFGGRVAS